MSIILITKLYNFTYKYRTKILNSYYCECINKPNLNNSLCVQKKFYADNNNPSDQCEKCQKIIDIIFGDGKLRASADADYQDAPDIRTMDGAELAQIITQAQIHPESKREKYQRIISQVFGSTEDNASNVPIALEEIKLLSTLNTTTTHEKNNEEKLITKIETMEEANVVLIDKKLKQDDTNQKKQTAHFSEPLIAKNITNKDYVLDIELKLCEIADHCLPDHIDGCILKGMKEHNVPKTTNCEKHIVPPLSFVVNNVINNDTNNNQYLFKRVTGEGSSKQTVIKRQQVVPKAKPNVQNTEPSPIPAAPVPIPQKQSGELDKLEPSFQPAITDKPLSCVGYTENDDIIIYMEECLSQPRDKLIKTCDELRMEEIEKEIKFVNAGKRDIDKETLTTNTSACKLKTNEDEINIEQSSSIMNQAKELAENLTVLASDSNSIDNKNSQLTETIVAPKHRKENETSLHNLQVNNFNLQEQREVKKSIGKNKVNEAELDVLTKKDAFDKAMKNIISANAAQISPKEKEQEEEQEIPVEKEKPKEDKELSLQELLQRVRRRHRMQYCQKWQINLNEPEGKCGDKKPPCPPPPKKCPPPPPPPQCPAPCPKPTPAPECPPPPKCPPDPPCPKPKCFKKINEKVDLILMKMYKFPHAKEFTIIPVFVGENDFCSVLDKNTTDNNFVDVVAKLVGRVKVAAKECETIMRKTFDDILDNILVNENDIEVTSCFERANIGQNLEEILNYSIMHDIANNLEDSICWTRGFEPWAPIPSWPYPKKVHKEPLCPKVGCKTPPPKLTDRCKEKPCAGFPKNR